LTRGLLQDGPVDERPDLCVITVDASRLAHGLYLVAQVRELATRVVVAVTMSDIAAQREVTADTAILSRELGCPVVATDPRRRTGMVALATAVRTTLADPVPDPRTAPITDDPLVLDDDRFTWLSDAADLATVTPGHDRLTLSDKVDRWVTAPVAGPLLFLAVMWAVFQLTTTVAAPLQDALDGFFSGPVSHAVTSLLALVHLQGTWVEGHLLNGLVAGVGMLLTFVPLMGLMFLLLALLEYSGYLARAAVVTDRLLRTMGLPGRAFLPLVVGFGCNVPAISATRILPDARQRLLTVLLVPFTSCSARLTVFVMLGTVFFGKNAGTAVFGMYVTSVALVVLIGLLLRRTLWRTMGAEPLIIDLPAYHVPTLRLTGAVVWQRLRGFLKTASGIIVATVCAVWLLQSIPTTGGQALGQVPVEDSVYRVAARTISPVIAPAGFDQWQTASAPDRRIRRQRSGHQLVGTDVRHRAAATRTDRPARRPHPRRVRAVIGRTSAPGGTRVHGVPARLHAVRRHPRRTTPRGRPPLDDLRRRDPARHGLASRRRCLPDRTVVLVSGPLHLVLDEITAGTPTLAAIARRTGLSDDVVRAAVDHLVRAGRITSTELSLGCPTGGCGGCPSAGTSCTLPTALDDRRPGLVGLSLTRRVA